MKISGVDIRPGNILEYEGGIWKVAKIQHTQPGKGGAYMQVEMKNLQDGRKTNVRFRSADTVVAGRIIKAGSQIQIAATIYGSAPQPQNVTAAANGEDVMTARDRYTVRDPLSIGDVQIVLRGIPFPVAGKYWIELRCNGELIGQRPFYVDVNRKGKDGAEGA